MERTEHLHDWLVSVLQIWSPPPSSILADLLQAISCCSLTSCPLISSLKLSGEKWIFLYLILTLIQLCFSLVAQSRSWFQPHWWVLLYWNWKCYFMLRLHIAMRMVFHEKLYMCFTSEGDSNFYTSSLYIMYVSFLNFLCAVIFAYFFSCMFMNM